MVSFIAKKQKPPLELEWIALCANNPKSNCLDFSCICAGPGAALKIGKTQARYATNKQKAENGAMLKA